MYVYQIDDPEAEGGKRQVERDELAKGYEYGRTVVHISESDENITKLETEAVMEIVGFVSSTEVCESSSSSLQVLTVVSSSGTFC
jgi:non-homologous end joining protein Ku